MISQQLAFEAGRVAQRLEWDHAALCEPQELHSAEPSGPPLMICCSVDLSVEQARTIAALHAAGRGIVALCEDPPPAQVLPWLPNGVLRVIPRAQHAPMTGDQVQPQGLMALWLQLASHDNRGVRSLTAESDRCPLECLAVLARDSEDLVRAAAAGNPRLPEDILLGLALDESSRVREAAISCDRLPPEWVQSLHHPPEERLLRARTQEDAQELRVLAEDSDERVRVAVARNASTPSDVLMKLASDESVRVQVACVRHPSTPPETALALARKALGDGVDLFDALEEELQYSEIESFPPMVGLFLMDGNEGFEHLLLSAPWVPAQRIVNAVASRDREVRGEAAKNPTLTPSMLGGLAKDPDAFVRAKTAGNPRTPNDLLAGLARDVESYGWTYDGGNQTHGPVCGGVSLNPNATSPILSSVLGTMLELWPMQADSRDFSAWVYRALAQHPNASSELLDDLIAVVRSNPDHDSAASIRREVAAHANASQEALLELVEGDDPYTLLALLERHELPGEIAHALCVRATSA